MTSIADHHQAKPSRDTLGPVAPTSRITRASAAAGECRVRRATRDEETGMQSCGAWWCWHAASAAAMRSSRTPCTHELMSSMPTAVSTSKAGRQQESRRRLTPRRPGVFPVRVSPRKRNRCWKRNRCCHETGATALCMCGWQNARGRWQAQTGEAKERRKQCLTPADARDPFSPALKKRAVTQQHAAEFTFVIPIQCLVSCTH